MECRGERKNNTHLSPRKSMTYAVTPPGILTSTRTSTRENALKQLHHGETNGSTKPIRAGGGRVQAMSIIYCPCSRMANAPKAAMFHFPRRAFCEPRLRIFDGIGKRVDVRRE